MKRKYNSGGIVDKMHNYPYVNTSYQLQPNNAGLVQQQADYNKTAEDQALLAKQKYAAGGYMQVPHAQVPQGQGQPPVQPQMLPQEGGYGPQEIGPELMTAETGGYMNKMKQYRAGGQQLPGGNMQAIPGSDAVQFNGASHDEGGIMLDEETEVEGGETMDQVSMAEKGGTKKDYFFSDHLKKSGMSYAEQHKSILAKGGDQKEIDMLAKMQEHQAGRDPKKVQTASTGGVKKYEDGGPKGDALPDAKNKTDRDKKYHAMAQKKGWYYDGNTNTYYFTKEKYNEAVKKQTAAGDRHSDGNPSTDAYVAGMSETYNMEVNDRNINPYRKSDPNYAQWNEQFSTAEENGLVWVSDPNRAGTGKWMDKNEAETSIADGSLNEKTAKEHGVEDADDNTNSSTASNNSNNSKSDVKRDNKYKVASYDVYGDNEGEFGTVPDFQPSYKVNGMQMYAGKGDTPFREALQKEDFRGEWMSNVDPAVLEKAGITSFSDMNTPEKVTAYQTAWNELHSDNKIVVDGLFGEQTFRTAIGGGDDEEIVEKPSEEEIVEETVVKKEAEVLEKKTDWLTPLVGAAQLIPAIYAFGDTPDYMSEHPMASPGAIIPERIAKTHLERIDMNPERARNANDFAALNKFVDTSGGGPSNMINKMASYAKKQQGDRDIASQEQRANVAIANQEGVMDQQRKTQNVMNQLDASKTNLATQSEVNRFNATMDGKVDEFNRGADAATKDRRLNALDSAVGTIAGMNKDRLQYNAQERLAQAISGQTGVYNRETYAQTLVAAGHVPGTDQYTNMMNAYIKKNQSGNESSTSSSTSSTETSTKTTKKKYAPDGSLIDESTTTAKTGGFIPTGFRKRYS